MIVERINPQTYFDGLHGWPCFKIFVEFYNKEIGDGNVHNIRLKKDFFEKKLLTVSEIKKNLKSHNR